MLKEKWEEGTKWEQHFLICQVKNTGTFFFFFSFNKHQDLK